MISKSLKTCTIIHVLPVPCLFQRALRTFQHSEEQVGQSTGVNKMAHFTL